MKRFLIAMALLGLFASASFAGDASCEGTITAHPDWTIVADGHRVCRFKTKSSLGKRILRVCPDGSDCTLNLSVDANVGDLGPHKDNCVACQNSMHHVWTITAWPQHGVECNDCDMGRAKRG